jgi:hypothetical protein
MNDGAIGMDSTHQRRVFHDVQVAEGAGLELSVSRWFRYQGVCRNGSSTCEDSDDSGEFHDALKKRGS